MTSHAIVVQGNAGEAVRKSAYACDEKVRHEGRPTLRTGVPVGFKNSCGYLRGHRFVN